MESKPLSVSQLNRQIRCWLESDIGPVTVLGELSNLSKPSSGHYYFTLKDQQAQLRCVYFRNYQNNGGPQPFYQEGQALIAKGKLSLYEARGDYQLIVHELTLAGDGELYFQFEQLKLQLQAQGLFDAQRKKAIPRFPQHIGIITSVNAAALQDILTTLARRYPLAALKVYNSEVQGKTAAQQLRRAVQRANEDQLCDVIIIARGGGSIEDLWAFNDKQLALAIYHSHIPIVSGIGHEIDFTIADFVADFRAATPTAAAEAVSPNQVELIQYLQALQRQLELAMHRFLQYQQLRLHHKMAKILSPKAFVSRQWQRLDYAIIQLQRAIKNLHCQKDNALRIKILLLNAQNPCTIILAFKNRLESAEKQLHLSILKVHQHFKAYITRILATLEALSPLATLKRGYAIVSDEKGLIQSSQQVSVGSTISIRLAHGALGCEVVTTSGVGTNQ